MYATEKKVRAAVRVVDWYLGKQEATPGTGAPALALAPAPRFRPAPLSLTGCTSADGIGIGFMGIGSFTTRHDTRWPQGSGGIVSG
jgi:hypothetical protein